MNQKEDRTNELIEFVAQYWQRNGYAPTLREIGEAIGVSSTSLVSIYRNAAIAQKRLAVTGRKNRTVKVVGHG